jgi:hypothetical protein
MVTKVASHIHKKYSSFDPKNRKRTRSGGDQLTADNLVFGFDPFTQRLAIVFSLPFLSDNKWELKIFCARLPDRLNRQHKAQSTGIANRDFLSAIKLKNRAFALFECDLIIPSGNKSDLEPECSLLLSR